MTDVFLGVDDVVVEGKGKNFVLLYALVNTGGVDNIFMYLNQVVPDVFLRGVPVYLECLTVTQNSPSGTPYVELGYKYDPGSDPGTSFYKSWFTTWSTSWFSISNAGRILGGLHVYLGAAIGNPVVLKVLLTW